MVFKTSMFIVFLLSALLLLLLSNSFLVDAFNLVVTQLKSRPSSVSDFSDRNWRYGECDVFLHDY